MSAQPYPAAIWTIGYSGHDPTSLLKALRDHRVEAIVDVRRNPVSRKLGFSRGRLGELLAAEAIQYHHIAALGVPPSLRERLRSGACDLAQYMAGFARYLCGREGSAGLTRLATLCAEQRCCLLCLEQRPQDCHRSLVAAALQAASEQPLLIMHIERPSDR